MKISNFRYIAADDEYYFAEVDVKESFQQSRTDVVYKLKEGYSWRWLITGQCTPEDVVDLLAGSYWARRRYRSLLEKKAD